MEELKRAVHKREVYQGLGHSSTMERGATPHRKHIGPRTHSPCLLREGKSDASPVSELRWVVDTGSRKLGAARHARQAGLGKRNKCSLCNPFLIAHPFAEG